MATNSMKKSSIPRATRDNDRLDQARSRPRGPKPPVSKPCPGHPHHSKPAPNDGLLKEDESAVRRSLLELEADHARMKQSLEDTVHEAEQRLATMEKLLAERERVCSANLNAATEKAGTLEQQVEKYEKALIENNIDPVTGEVVEPSPEQSAAVEKQKKVTKRDVNKMREKLHQMDEVSDKYLTDIQNMLQEIEELESTSQRVSNTSELEESLSGSDMKVLIHEVEEAQQKEEQQRKKEKREEGAEEEEDNEEEEEERQSPSPKPDEKENFMPPSKPDVFIT